MQNIRLRTITLPDKTLREPVAPLMRIKHR
jgi:hypothetical protein